MAKIVPRSTAEVPCCSLSPEKISNGVPAFDSRAGKKSTLKFAVARKSALASHSDRTVY